MDAPPLTSNTAFVPVQNFTGSAVENEHFFFHPDHLGSSNYITNFDGAVTQHTEYFAFGETFVDEHRNSHNSPYKFNGKEYDEESGYTYYGARYLDMKTSIWISVDPLAEKYPSISTYAYCANNPIIFIDPDGKKIKGVTLIDGKFTYTDQAIKNGTQKYIEARMKTESGRKSIMKMIDASKTYTLLVTDKVIVMESPKSKGKYALCGALTSFGAGVMLFTTNPARPNDVTNEQLQNAVTMNNSGDLEPIKISRDNFVIPLADPTDSYQADIKQANIDSGMELFDTNNPYKDETEQLHGLGAHEETHLMDPDNIKFQKKKETYKSEKQAFEAEKEARKEYQQENKN